MKAAIYRRYGTPEVISIEDIAMPDARHDQLLIKIHATTVNRTDAGFLTGKPYIARLFAGLMKPKYNILGNEFAGEIIKVGKSIKSYNAGDRIFGMNGIQFGMHAQYIVLNENAAIARIPEGFSYVEAASICEGAFYANTYLKSIKLGKGDSILINGSTGAIGVAAVQLAKYYGANITAVGNTKNIELVKSLGATRVVDYLKEDFTEVLKGQQFDYIFDAVGKSTFRKCKHLLKPSGTFFATELGPWWQNPWFALWTGVFKKMPLSKGKKVIFPLPIDSKAGEMVETFAKLLEKGHLQSVVDRTYSLEEIADAYRYVMLGEKTGSVVIKNF